MTDDIFPNHRSHPSSPPDQELLGLAFELVSLAPFPYLILSPQGGVLYANHAALRLLGHELALVPGLPLSALVAAHDCGTFTDWVTQARQECGASVELQLLPGGEPVDVRLVAETVSTESAESVLAVAVHDRREVRESERRLRQLGGQLEWRVRERNEELGRANEQLRRKIEECGVLELQLRHRMQELGDADRAKDEFLALLAHELRNPLAPIRNALEVLREPQLPAGTREWAQEVIERQVEHLRRLVDDLLDLSRVSRGKIELQCRPVRLEDAVNRALELSGPLIASRRHRIERRHWPEPLLVNGDLERLAQVIANLLNNAAKYMDSGGVIGIEFERDDNDACLIVRDTGQGIEPDLLPRVFEPFTQGDRSLHRTKGGLGLGLALVKRLVELHGGRVTARSAGADLGAEFEIRLPRVEHALVSTSGPARTATPRSRRRVLVVEDNIDAAETLRMLLELHGHEARVAFDAGSALAAVSEFLPDTMLLDIGLPDMSGRELVGLLRSRPETAGALIVAVSGYGTERDIEASRAAGFDQHLVKPVSPNALEATLAISGADVSR